jgi:hypothetical protein
MNACTSIEQSKKLIELGIDRETSDVFYWCEKDLRIGGYKAQSEEFDIPAWSLSALIGLIPDKIQFEGNTYYLNIKKTKIEYLGPVTWEGQLCKSFEADNLIDAVFKAICWLKNK